MKVTTEKACFCYLCNKPFHYLGIARHVAMHRDRKETCLVKYSDGKTYRYQFGDERTPNHA